MKTRPLYAQRKALEKILAMPDSREKLIKLSDLMLEVELWGTLWHKARNESKRLQSLGFDF